MKIYSTLSGHHFSLDLLDPQEFRILTEFQKRFEKGLDWNEFENYWIATLSSLYDKRKVPRRLSMQKPLFQIAQDMWGRLAIQQGHVEPPDYRDELAELIDQEFGTRREFCRKTGMSEQMVSHALAHRKHIHINRLVHALHKIGYRLSITPAPANHATGRRNGVRSKSRRTTAR